MDPSEFLNLSDFPEVMPDLVPLFPVEALPIEMLPVAAATWATRMLLFFSRHALVLAFFGAMIENTILLGFLLPGGTVVALAAAGGRTANISLPLLVLLSGAGMTCGAVVDYYLGKAGVHQLLHRRWAGKLGKRLANQLHNAAPLLYKHGWWVILFAHAFGHGRSSLALAAGASGFPLKRFLIIEIPAALLWSALYAGGGYLLAAQWQSLELVLRRAGWVGAAAVAIGGIGWWLWHKYQPTSPEDPEPVTNVSVPSNGASSVNGHSSPAPEPAQTAPSGADRTR